MSSRVSSGEQTNMATMRPVLGIPVSPRNLAVPDDLDAWKSSDRALIVTFVNPHAVWRAENDPAYLRNLAAFDFVLCDGIGMVRAARRFAGLAIERAGFDLTALAGPVLEWIAENAVPLVLVGGKAGVAGTAAQQFRTLVPRIEIIGVHSGYNAEPDQAVEFLSGHQRAAVVCGMGAPRQEAFLLRARDVGWRGLGFTCGGFFDQISERIEYYPAWVDWMNLRFLYRLCKEPRRLWRRYLIEYQVFLRKYLKALFAS